MGHIYHIPARAVRADDPATLFPGSEKLLDNNGNDDRRLHYLHAGHDAPDGSVGFLWYLNFPIVLAGKVYACAWRAHNHRLRRRNGVSGLVEKVPFDNTRTPRS